MRPAFTAPSRGLRFVRLGLLAAVVGASCSSPVDEELRADFHAALGGTSLTVYPAFVRTNAPEGPGYDAAAADRIGAWLAEHELARVSRSSEEVALPADAQGYQYDVWCASAQAFGEWIADHPIDTAYALLPEYLITRVPSGGTQAGGIHAFVVDAQGRLVDGLLLNSHQALFREAAASTPAECTEVVLAALADDWAVAR